VLVEQILEQDRRRLELKVAIQYFHQFRQPVVRRVALAMESPADQVPAVDMDFSQAVQVMKAVTHLLKVQTVAPEVKRQEIHLPAVAVAAHQP
jgi:hypothetical protein